MFLYGQSLSLSILQQELGNVFEGGVATASEPRGNVAELLRATYYLY